ncbi:hypothetical protein B0H14DRAFT_3774187 [Mycena olivaceomarginata]|nr:hypothetical protein B0H14DRAFT_3774187 [Mycena olivaceomarginata]
MVVDMLGQRLGTVTITRIRRDVGENSVLGTRPSGTSLGIMWDRKLDDPREINSNRVTTSPSPRVRSPHSTNRVQGATGTNPEHEPKRDGREVVILHRLRFSGPPPTSIFGGELLPPLRKCRDDFVDLVFVVVGDGHEERKLQGRSIRGPRTTLAEQAFKPSRVGGDWDSDSEFSGLNVIVRHSRCGFRMRSASADAVRIAVTVSSELLSGDRGRHVAPVGPPLQKTVLSARTPDGADGTGAGRGRRARGSGSRIHSPERQFQQQEHSQGPGLGLDNGFGTHGHLEPFHNVVDIGHGLDSGAGKAGSAHVSRIGERCGRATSEEALQDLSNTDGG